MEVYFIMRLLYPKATNSPLNNPKTITVCDLAMEHHRELKQTWQPSFAPQSHFDDSRCPITTKTTSSQEKVENLVREYLLVPECVWLKTAATNPGKRASLRAE